MPERHAMAFYRTKKDMAIVRAIAEFIPENGWRFLSDKRPSHAFYEFKAPETITAVVSMNKIRRLPTLWDRQR